MLNEGLQRIGIAAFRDCPLLESIILPTTVNKLGSYAFSRCTNLKELVLNQFLMEIGTKAFEQCTTLESITLPSITKVGREAFNCCSSLREVMIDEDLQKFGCNAFGNCPALLKFTFPGLSTRLESIFLSGDVEACKRIKAIRALGWNETELSIHAIAMESWRNWDIIKQDINRIHKLIIYYEIKEATTLLELALWKAKIDQAGDNNPAKREAIRSRDSYRIGVPGPVKDAILQCIGRSLLI